ncbi:MAG TPA: peptidase T [Planctomycetota bacterium]|nr:peptidase T [Planctomycetota bacterium]
MIDSEDLLARFLAYVQIDTQSSIHSETTPSTEKQWVLIRKLEGELKELGLADVKVTPFGFVLATIPGTSKKTNAPRLAFLAHVDTADACPGRAKPIVHRSYDGSPIVLPDDPRQVLDTNSIPLLATKIGEDIVTASGATLLGADDKSGVATVMAAAKYWIEHPEVPHGPVRICFNPDEEIGRGTEKLSLEELAADAAYTLDAENLGEVDFESFSAARAVLTFTGVAAHPGWAKGVMVNAMRLATEFLQAMPAESGPENASGREGFIHPVEIVGTPEQVRIEMLLRDFEIDGLAAKHRLVEKTVAKLREKEPRARINLEIYRQYANMRYWLERDMRPVNYAMDAIRAAGLTPTTEAIRGGTDGSRLTERGLPTPNLFTGFHNVHSEKEWVSLQDMCKAAETLVHLARIWEERA